MYESKYYKETEVEKKDEITSGALTVGIICTIITILFALLKSFGS